MPAGYLSAKCPYSFTPAICSSDELGDVQVAQAHSPLAELHDLQQGTVDGDSLLVGDTRICGRGILAIPV